MANQYVNKVVQSDGTTLIDITDTTSVASDVKQGTYFYLATGEKVQGSAPGTYSVTLALTGASSSATGTKVVSGGSYFTEITPTTTGHKISSITVTMGGVDITSQVFKPGVGGKAITANGTYNASSDNLSGYDTVTVNVSGGGGGTPAISVVDTTDTQGGTIREITALDISDTTAVASDVAQGKYFYTAQGVKTQGTGSGGTPSATAHTIYFEFSDNTNTTITAYYDDSFISDAITTTTPTTYGSKTVTLAQLDGVTWYEYDPSETWETLVNGNVAWIKDNDNDYPYCWISSLGNVSIPNGSVWRITYDNVEYRLTAVSGSIGNPKWGKGTDDGTNVPFIFNNSGWGAWTGSLNAPNVDSNYYFKIERLVTS